MVSITAIRPDAGPQIHSLPAVPGFAGSFVAVLANEMPNLPQLAVTEFDWLAFRRAHFALEDDASRKRLKALRKRDPALAARMERILRLPVSEQAAALAETAAVQSRRVAQVQPARPEQAAYFATRAMMARSISLTSIFDRPNLMP